MSPQQLFEARTFIKNQLNFNDIPVVDVQLVGEVWHVETPYPVIRDDFVKNGVQVIDYQCLTDGHVVYICK